MLVAAPGTGKSVLMEQWLHGRRACTLELTPAHDDAVAVARELTAALRSMDDSVDAAVGALAPRGGHRLGPQFLDALLGELGAEGPSLLLALDDAHRLTNRALVEDLGELLLRLPARCRAVISAQWDPPLPRTQLRLQGRVVELRWDDLAFDVNEARELLERSSGVAVTSDQVKVLLERTDGWAAGLQLAAHSMRNVADVDAFVRGFAGDDRLVADYLTGEILRTLPPDLRSFLLRTSILETLSPAACDAVTSAANGGQMLTALGDRGLFISELERSEGVFRYHKLFAELLRFELRAEGAEVEREYRRRAAGWLIAHGEHRAGFEQLLAAGDHHAAFEVIKVEGHRLFERGETGTLARGLRLIHDRDPAPTPLMGINLMASQVGADEFAAAGETYRTLTGRDDLTSGERIAADTLAAMLGLGDLPESQMRYLADGVLDALARVDRTCVVDFLGVGGADSCETMAAFAAGMADFFTGDVVQSVAAFERVLGLRGAAYPLWRVNTLGALALSRAWIGRLNEAEASAITALDVAREVGAMDHIACALAHLAAAIVHIERLDLGRAGVHLAAARALIDRAGRPTYRHLLDIVRARHRGVSVGAHAALAVLRGTPTGEPVRPVVATARTALEAQLLLRCGALPDAREVLAATGRPAPAAAIDVLLTEDDLQAAGALLDQWHPHGLDRRARLEHGLRRAARQHRAGHPGAAGAIVAEAAASAEAEELLTPFLDVPLALHILRTAAPTRPLPRITVALLSSPAADDGRVAANQRLTEPLTAREITVLEYLPTRLSNVEIAEALFISVNTLKTHLRSLYRKLGVANRAEGIDRAGALGLLDGSKGWSMTTAPR